MQEAARVGGQNIHILLATTERDINAAFNAVTELRAGALLVGADPFFNSQRDHLVALATRNAIPALYEFRELP